jgi:electron transfer flavoprotein alpha subunit
VAVDCEPTQQALVRQIEIDGEPRTIVQCVTGALATATMPASAPAIATLTPAVYQPAAPVRQVTAAPAPIRTVSSPVRRQTTSERQAATDVEQRSWQKRALVIGGSAGAGAGIGALIGGKKGALIGAAIGGGSAAIWDQVTRR